MSAFTLLGLPGLGACQGEPATLPGLDERPANPTCVAPPRPAQVVELQRAFPGLSFAEPVQMQITSDGAWWYVAERAGRVWRFSADPSVSQAELVLDLTSQIDSSVSGLLGLALHPSFAINGDLFVSFTAYGGLVVLSRVSRFHSSDGGASFEPGGEQVVLEIEQVARRHHNADLQFGPDGYLYVGFGDGAAQGDPEGVAQDPDQLKGKILRLDIDSSSPYAIPSDNPYAAGGGAPEVWALGLRNPWRFTFDRATGELWAGDVGWNGWEELDLIVGGGNYGWNLREGTHCPTTAPCDAPGTTDPVVEYGHDQGRSITAGYVYRGDSIAALTGQVVYADFMTGYLWAIDPLAQPPIPRVINADGHNVVSFAEDLDGEQYLIDLWQGTIWRLAPGSSAPADVPRLLSATGCFGRAGEPAAGLIPYDLNVPFWSDGADKRRWMAIPDGQTIEINDELDLEFPVGSVLAKEFKLSDQHIETRLLVRHDDGEWAGYTYLWDPAQTDATLIPLDSAATVVDWGDHAWYYPRRADCLLCHTSVAGRTLGLELSQLEREVRYPSGRTADQLTTLEQIGLFRTPLPDERPALPATDADAPLADRARAWLHANCSYCHRPGGAGQGAFDLRFTTALADMNVCDVVPEEGDLEIADPRRLAPGAPERSVLSARIRSEAAGRMPPLASAIIDTAGADLVDAWISSLSSCE